MYVVMNRLSAPMEFAGRIEQGFVQAGPGMRAVAGFVDFRLLRLRAPSATDDAGAEVLYIAETTWQDETSYEAWARSDLFARAHSGGGATGSPLTATLERFELVGSQASEA